MQACRIGISKYILLIVPCIILTAHTSALEPVAEKEIRTVLSAEMDLARQGWATPPDAESLQKKYGAALIPYLKEYTTHLGELVAQLDIEALCIKYGAVLLPYLDQYTKDPDSHVRLKAYTLIVSIGRKAGDNNYRKATVYKLLTCLRQDKEHNHALGRMLLQFKASDFSTEAKELLRQLLSQALIDLKMNGYVRGYIILLVGVADMKSELSHLKEFIEQQEDKLIQEHKKSIDRLENLLDRIPEEHKARRNTVLKMLRKQYWQDTLMWQALRARARMGVKKDILRCIELVELHPDEDYRVAFLLGQLAYVRQPEIVNYLQKYLNSDNLESYKGYDTIRKSYAQRAAMAISKMLYGFPENPDYGGNQETIEHCRKWMAEQTEWRLIR